MSIVHTATCFDFKKSASGYSVKHSIDISSNSAYFGIPKSLHGKIQVKLLQYCPDILIILFKLNDNYQSIWTRYLMRQDNNFIKILTVFLHVNFLGFQNVHCYLIYLCYGSLNSLMMTSKSRNISLCA